MTDNTKALEAFRRLKSQLKYGECAKYLGQQREDCLTLEAALTAPAEPEDESLYEVGEALIKAIENNLNHPALKGWSPTDCPSEIVCDLLNYIDELPASDAARIEELEAALKIATDYIAVQASKHRSAKLAIEKIEAALHAKLKGDA